FYVADLDRRLSVADVVVVPSRTEGQGLVALEAMALGVPVVASRVGGLPEVVEDQLTGLLVPPDDWEALADALLRLAMDPSLRARLGEAARLRVRERFSIETLLDRMAELYRATQNSLQGRMSPAG
ncbi:MAG: glycosyltransferase family 4 protein, partial [Armatimonadetes bacterium]|nr:glycosyltransferase family 4 protein [Armatimonadota bacterium]